LPKQLQWHLPNDPSPPGLFRNDQTNQESIKQTNKTSEQRSKQRALRGADSQGSQRWGCVVLLLLKCIETVQSTHFSDHSLLPTHPRVLLLLLLLVLLVVEMYWCVLFCCGAVVFLSWAFVVVVVDDGDEGFLNLCHQHGCFVVLVLFVVLKIYLKKT
jgi:hypothetical protein